MTATTDTTSTAGRGNCAYAAATESRKLFLRSSTSQPSHHHSRVNAESYKKDMGFEHIEFVDGLGNAGMWLPEARQLTVVVPGYEVQVIDMTASGEATLTLAQTRAR